jgi:hypothetical protein
MRTGAIAHEVIRQIAVRRLEGAGARATTAGVRAAVRRRGGGSAIIVLREAVRVDADAARAIQMLVTGATAETEVVVGTVVDAGGRSEGP